MIKLPILSHYKNSKICFSCLENADSRDAYQKVFSRGKTLFQHFTKCLRLGLIFMENFLAAGILNYFLCSTRITICW